jgi:hypothetical protein
MSKLRKMFFKGRMNKSTDERHSPKGEHTDALNIRINSVSVDGMYIAKTALGNSLVASPAPEGISLSDSAVGIGSFEDKEFDRIFVFVHDPSSSSSSGVMDLIYSYNVNNGSIDYNLVSIDDGTGATTMGFTPDMVITEFELIENELYFITPGKGLMVIDTNVIYGTDSTVDQFSIYDILVIKRPPLNSPSIELLNVSDTDDYLLERFVCYGYRYKYANNKYSATSQFKFPAFLPGAFQISYETFNNEGMRNSFNAVKLLVNSGASDVIGVDILMKDSTDNLIKVIERVDKVKDGIVDNTEISYVFSGNKLFNILPQSEILRLNDAVPTFANTMTRVGGRLMYSDYTEGFNMVDKNNNKFNSTFSTSLISATPNRESIDSETYGGYYAIDGSGLGSPACRFEMDLDGVELTKGSYIRASVTIEHYDFEGDPPYPTDTPGPFTISLEFYLSRDYSSPYVLASSDEFKAAVGTTGNVATMTNACTAAPMSFTDLLNCTMPETLSGLTKVSSGINTRGDGSQIITYPSSSDIVIQIPLFVYVDDVATPTQTVWSILQITDVSVIIQNDVNSRSLHSDWEYEALMVYMDEFGRSSFPVPSDNNTVKIPFANSSEKNSIRVTIPDTMRPPKWASKFKFVLRSNKSGYQTIYSYLVYKEGTATFFLIEGENAAKVEIGDELIVKSDMSGPMTTKRSVKILEKEVFEADKFEVGSPSGAYMKVIANDFNTEIPPDSIIIVGTKRDSRTPGTGAAGANDYPFLAYPINSTNITPGTRIRFEFNIGRRGYSGGCGAESYRLNKTFISKGSYTDLKEWWDSEDVNFDDNSAYVTGSEVENTWTYDNTLVSRAGVPVIGDLPQVANENKVRFAIDSSTGQNYMLIRSGTPGCTGAFESDKRASSIDFRMDIIKGGSSIIFETKPSYVNEDIYYEGNQSFDILSDAHLGSVQDQVIGTQPSIIDLNFFNCFSFGNGAESYRIDDSVTGREFTLGERVYGTQSGEFKEVKRTSDITYSGVFNDESNVNKLNEFNAGLLNFKRLEEKFGPVAKISGRASDILVLQQDKISYVLFGKNLLSDAVGGGPITSVPEVLGTIIPRLEDIGCSNRESFSTYGALKSFVDTKRGIVVELKGGGYSSEQLSVIVNGMGGYFRDLMIENDNKLFLGAYDKFNKEYVLHTNETDKPGFTPVYNCGSSRSLEVVAGKNQVYDVDFGAAVGEAIIEYTVGILADTIEVSIEYNGVTYTSGLTDSSGSISFSKTLPSVELGTVTVLSSSGTANVIVKSNCVLASTLSVRTIVLTSNTDVNKNAHVGYSWDKNGYISPDILDEVTFPSTTSSINRSLDKTRTGKQGTPSIPVQQADIKMFVKNNPSDGFVFDPAKHKMYWMRTDLNLTDSQLISSTNDGSPILQDSAGNNYYLIDLLTATGSTLYLIFDLRENTSLSLCYSTVSAFDACCNC